MERPLILLVEDNSGDQRLTLEALKGGTQHSDVKIVQDGVEAMAYLRQQAPYLGAPLPQIVILDLNLPKKDGREVLAEIKQDPRLRRIPVVVLTTSKAEEDIFKAYDYHANCFIAKPVDLDHFFAVIRSIEHFWLKVVELPSHLN